MSEDGMDEYELAEYSGTVVMLLKAKRDVPEEYHDLMEEASGAIAALIDEVRRLRKICQPQGEPMSEGRLIADDIRDPKGVVNQWLAEFRKGATIRAVARKYNVSNFSISTAIRCAIAIEGNPEGLTLDKWVERENGGKTPNDWNKQEQARKNQPQGGADE